MAIIVKWQFIKSHDAELQIASNSV